MATIIRQRRDTTANWSSVNPVIPDGQLVFDTTNDTFRVGDGLTHWADLGETLSGSGDMQASNNLSELTDTAVAITNLGIDSHLNLGTAATADSTDFEAADTNISKTDDAETRTANIDLLTYTEKHIAIGSNGTIDMSLGTVFTHDHASGHTTPFNLSNVPTTGTSGFIFILNNGGSHTPMDWFTGSTSTPIKWPAGIPPTFTVTGTDIFTFTTTDSGVTWYGIPSGIGMA